jgi:hypothetical protein
MRVTAPAWRPTSSLGLLIGGGRAPHGARPNEWSPIFGSDAQRRAEIGNLSGLLTALAIIRRAKFTTSATSRPGGSRFIPRYKLLRVARLTQNLPRRTHDRLIPIWTFSVICVTSRDRQLE